MGSSRTDVHAYAGYTRSVAAKSAADIFTNTSGCHADLYPGDAKMRESVDSIANPNSTPVIIGVDVTGSMGHLATEIVKKGLEVIITGIYDRKPVTDPHIMLAAIGDMYCDTSPLQVTQFEADAMVLTKQIEKFFIEGGGGGNNGESYSAIWCFAAHKTVCDAIAKRGAKGYIFTVGDERVLPTLPRDKVAGYLGISVEADVSTAELLERVKENWNVFHLIITTAATNEQRAVDDWRKLLGERAIVISDHTKLGEIIVSIMQVNEGADADEVAKSWGHSTALLVKDATGSLAKATGKLTVEQV